MTRYYCKDEKCKLSHKKRPICCWYCPNFAWCKDTGVIGDCHYQTCGKCERVSDHHWRYFRYIQEISLTWLVGLSTKLYPVRKCLKKKILRGKKYEAKRNRRNRVATHHTPLA